MTFNPLYIGIPQETELNESKRLVLVNVLTIIGIAINLFYFFFFFSMGKVVLSTFNLSLAIIIGTLGFYYMKTGKYKIAKVFILITIPVVLILFCTIYGDLGLDLFFLLFCISSFFILDNTKTILLINFWIFAIFVLMHIGIDREILAPIDEDLANWAQYFYWSNLLFGFLSNVIMLAIFKAENLRYEISLKEKNTQILQQNEEISAQRDLLDKTNNTKNKLFSIVAHDLKNPFIGMIHGSEILIDAIKNNSDDKVQLLDTVESIQQSTKNGFKLLENLLEWSRSQTDNIKCNPSEVNISEVIQESINSLQPFIDSKKIKVTYVDKPNQVWVDKNMLSSILRNLLSNAIKYTNANGSVSIELKGNGDVLEVKVSDSGVGMSEELKSKLFSIDFIDTTPGTQKEKGTGLGLLVCKDFIKKNGGDIWVESELGKGSTFHFTIPLAKN